MQAPKQIQELVQAFESQLEAYKSASLNETELRIEYVNPFFEALGWDINNRESSADAYKDVVHEYSLSTSSGARAPDYCFRIGSVPKFLLETKKPSVNIKEDAGPAFQIRSYGLSAGLSLCILTDFEEFSVYDCRFRPKPGDRASVARIFYCAYREYLEKWEQIYNIFSKEAVRKGLFDDYVKSDAKKRGATTIDRLFLEDMEKWRDLLARNIALRNASLSSRELNHLVQATIDRIVFLRICEDRNIEPPDQLRELAEKENIYSALCGLFERADEKYNSGLFHFKNERGGGEADRLSLSLSIDNKVLKEIIAKLYYPSPYIFSVIPAEILGQVYEQFLGKVIRLTPSHQAKVEFKPEVRKAGGVYYTPKYIVDYIVENAVGQLLKGKSPEQAKKLRILDPACGSGSFLLGAYQFLLGWYLGQYAKDPRKHKKLIYDAGEADWRLSTQEKKRILLSNIYGVDIDRQAVEVTKLSLLLKVLEGESKDTLDAQLRMFAERALPDLGDNIKCGNSLIGTGFLLGKNLELFGKEDVEKINPFDWDGRDGFPDIMKTGGFDAVIGNPPYVKNENLSPYLIEYGKENYSCAIGLFDIFQLFLEKSFQLINNRGLLSFIIPSLFLKGMNYKSSRKYFLDNSEIKIIKDYGDGVFSGVQMPTCVIIFIKNNKNNNYIQYNAKFHRDARGDRHGDESRSFKVRQQLLKKDDYIYIFNSIVNKMKFPPFLGDEIDIRRGLEIGKDKKIEKGVALLFGENIDRYLIKSVNYIAKSTYSNFAKEEKIFIHPKIIIRETGKRITAVYDEAGIKTSRSLYCIRSDKINLKYLLSIINSTLLQYYYKSNFMANTDIFPKIRIGQVQLLPIKKLNLAKPHQKAQHDRMVSLVDQMLATQKKLQAATSEIERKPYQQMADALDRQIDALVYELYELTPEEVRIVEGDANA